MIVAIANLNLLVESDRNSFDCDKMSRERWLMDCCYWPQISKTSCSKCKLVREMDASSHEFIIYWFHSYINHFAIESNESNSRLDHKFACSVWMCDGPVSKRNYWTIFHFTSHRPARTDIAHLCPSISCRQHKPQPADIPPHRPLSIYKPLNNLHINQMVASANEKCSKMFRALLSRCRMLTGLCSANTKRYWFSVQPLFFVARAHLCASHSHAENYRPYIKQIIN